MLTPEEAVLLVVDIQGKLAQLMYQKDLLFANACRMVQGAQVLDLPIIWTEQIPEKLGPTVEPVAQALQNHELISKSSFSCWGEPRFREALQAEGREQVFLLGIETHICIYQTARDLLAQSYEVHVVADAVSSRTPENRSLALQKMQSLGAHLTCTEMALYEMLEDATHHKFRQILSIVK